MRIWIRGCLSLFAFCLLAATLSASQQDVEEDDELHLQHPGIWATYTGGGKTISRRDPDIAFIWHGASPLQQLPSGPFKVDWKGNLLVRAPGKYRLHAHLQGDLSVNLGGKQALTAKTESNGPPQWVSGPEVELDFGQLPLSVTFKSEVPDCRIKLYWSSDSFAFEPIPAGVYFMNEAHPEAEVASRGRELFTSHRCNRCHQRENDPLSPPGPDLTHVATGLQGRWIENWLAGHSPDAARRTMPQFAFNDQEVQAIAVFLRSQSTDVSVDSSSVNQDATITEAGRTLFHTMGCLACHSHSGLGSQSSLGGGDLSTIGDKRTAAWLKLWLTDPQKLNADHRMPTFKWQKAEKPGDKKDDKKADKPDELTAIVAFLASSRKQPTAKAGAVESPTPVLVEQGKQLVEAARCAACHRIKGVASSSPAALPNLESGADSAKSCLQKNADRNNWRPAFPATDQAAIQAYLKERAGKLAPEGSVELGQRLLAWNNCLQCHPRDGARGLAANIPALKNSFPDLAAQSPTLIPPALNAVGDKLREQALLNAVGGLFDTPRMSWLQVRMPRFDHSELERQVLARFLTEHDRIESPPEELVAKIPSPTASERFAEVAVGYSLLGSQGFSCTACHQVGTYQPRDVALGTRGSDLMHIGKRMRREYFFRWTHSPIRITPDMEMPGYERPLPDVSGGRIDLQLAALWEALQADSSLIRPLDVSTVQQSFAVAPRQPARIVRDVFLLRSSIAKEKESYVAHAFAVGLNTKHNILFDLDTMGVRDWWFGDFAQQRTQGKSWNWESNGIRLIDNTAWPMQDILFMAMKKGEEVLLPSPPQFGTVGQLIDYVPDGHNGVRFNYWLNVPGLQNSQSVAGHLAVTEEWSPINAAELGKMIGWSRKITTTSLPDLYPVFVRPALTNRVAAATIDLPADSSLKWRLPKGEGSEQVPEVALLASDGTGRFTGTFHYLSRPVATVPSLPARPSLMSQKQQFATVPGYTATRLPLPASIMPTALTWTKDGTFAFASLKGHIYTAKDTDGDGLEDHLTEFEEGLAAPYGIITDPADGSLIVSQKPELIRLIDTDGDGRADLRKVFSTGWGYNDNYHDWTCGIVRDSKGNLYVGLGSDYTQKNRPVEQQHWRGKILRIDPSGKPTPIARGLRYPTGLAMTPEDDLFVTDNQGEQNLFNELNYIVEGAKYGVPSREDPKDDTPASTPAIQIPHPWTRSINGIFFIPRDAKLGAGKSEGHPFAGHGIGCEYDTRFLIRFTLQKVGDTFQGAVYPFSREKVPATETNFEGTLCGGVSPKGDIYIGCIHDSGWLGGLNVGSLVKLQSTGAIPLGIRELQATPHGFQIDFTGPIDREAASAIASYTISAYTRKWQGTYATPDSDRHQVKVSSVTVSDDNRRVILKTDPLRTGFVYEVTCSKIGPDREQALWPAIGHYTVNRVPVEK